MALDDSAVSDLLDALAVGEGTDLVRQLAQWALQQLIEAEATDAIGAEAWERGPARVTHRNGHRSRVLSTKAGDLQLGIPGSSDFPREPRECSNLETSADPLDILSEATLAASR